jgi:hypothetical protein
MPEQIEDPNGRINRRGRTLKTGKVWFNDNQSVMNCQVRDMSETGSRVRFEIAFDCPEHVALYLPIDENEGHIRVCITKWVRGMEAGLYFRSKAQLVLWEDIPKKVETWMKSTWAPID